MLPPLDLHHLLVCDEVGTALTAVSPPRDAPHTRKLSHVLESQRRHDAVQDVFLLRGVEGVGLDRIDHLVVGRAADRALHLSPPFW